MMAMRSVDEILTAVEALSVAEKALLVARIARSIAVALQVPVVVPGGPCRCACQVAC